MSPATAVEHARRWIENLETEAHWARTPAIREEAITQAEVLKALVEATGE